MKNADSKRSLERKPNSGSRFQNGLGSRISNGSIERGPRPEMAGGMPRKPPVGHKTPGQRSSSGTKDQELMTSMMQRLSTLENLNKTLRMEVKEKSLKINTLQNENERLRLASSDESADSIAKLIVERDKYQKRCKEME